MWKFKWKMGKETWMLLLAAGVIFLILALPAGKSKSSFSQFGTEGIGISETKAGVEQPKGKTSFSGLEAQVSAKAGKATYEEELENRVKEILKHVDGVGEVDVLIVLKSSEEKILRVDTNRSSSITEEKDSGGGTRKIQTEEEEENTILSGSGGQGEPMIEKELRPEISGIIISAEGGGSPTIKAEISAAMEALFDLPAHKIKVLKRVE